MVCRIKKKENAANDAAAGYELVQILEWFWATVNATANAKAGDEITHNRT